MKTINLGWVFYMLLFLYLSASVPDQNNLDEILTLPSAKDMGPYDMQREDVRTSCGSSNGTNECTSTSSSQRSSVETSFQGGIPSLSQAEMEQTSPTEIFNRCASPVEKFTKGLREIAGLPPSHKLILVRVTPNFELTDAILAGYDIVDIDPEMTCHEQIRCFEDKDKFFEFTKILAGTQDYCTSEIHLNGRCDKDMINDLNNAFSVHIQWDLRIHMNCANSEAFEALKKSQHLKGKIKALNLGYNASLEDLNVKNFRDFPNLSLLNKKRFNRLSGKDSPTSPTLHVDRRIICSYSYGFHVLCRESEDIKNTVIELRLTYVRKKLLSASSYAEKIKTFPRLKKLILRKSSENLPQNFMEIQASLIERGGNIYWYDESCESYEVAEFVSHVSESSSPLSSTLPTPRNEDKAQTRASPPPPEKKQTWGEWGASWLRRGPAKDVSSGIDLGDDPLLNPSFSAPVEYNPKDCGQDVTPLEIEENKEKDVKVSTNPLSASSPTKNVEEQIVSEEGGTQAYTSVVGS